MVGIAVDNRERGPDPRVPPRVPIGWKGDATSTNTTTTTTATAPDAANASVAADSSVNTVGSSVDELGVVRQGVLRVGGAAGAVGGSEGVRIKETEWRKTREIGRKR